MLDKENSLTFQNITQAMKINRSRKSRTCCFHQDKAAKYRNRQSDLLYCVSCAIQEASRGAIVEDLSKGSVAHSQHSKLALLQDIYQQSQQQIHEYISLYNKKHQKLMEAMADLQIRDLITFNRKIEENHNLFRRIKDQANQNWDKFSLATVFQIDSSAIFQNVDQLYHQITAIATSNQHKPNKTRSGIASPQGLSCRSSPKHKSKNRSQIIEPEGLILNESNNSLQAEKIKLKQNNSRQSFAKSQPNTGSYASKNSTIQQFKKSTLEDTPQSVKLMMSQSGFRTTNAMATTMFEKIDICESINVGQPQEKSSQDSYRASLLRKNRYERNQE